MATRKKQSKGLTTVPAGAVYQETEKWHAVLPAPDFTGVVARKQLYNTPYAGRSITHWHIEHFRDGKKHREDGPAVVWWSGEADDTWETPPQRPVYVEYFLDDAHLSKVAWTAAVAAKAAGNAGAVLSIKKQYTFTGSFESEEFEYHGFDGTMWCVRIGDQWYVLDAPSRKSGTFTRKINDLKKECAKYNKPEVVEVSQVALERLMVEQINQVLRS